MVACGGAPSSNSSSSSSVEGAFHNNEFSIDFDNSWKVIRNFQVLQDSRVTRGNIVFALLHQGEGTEENAEKSYSALTISKDEYVSNKTLEDLAGEIQKHLQTTLQIKDINSSRVTISGVKTQMLSFVLGDRKYIVSFVSEGTTLYYFVGSTTSKEENALSDVQSVIESFNFVQAPSENEEGEEKESE